MANRMLRAVQDCNSAPDPPTPAESARRNHVPASTLYHRLAGRPPPPQAHKKQQLLSDEEEEALVEELLRLIEQNFSPSLGLLCCMARSMVQAREQDPVPEVGKNWPQRFIKRHSDALAEAWSAPLSSKWAEAGAGGVVEPFLIRLQRLQEKKGILSEDLWNMDEKGYITGFYSRQRVLVRPGKARVDRQRRTPGNRDFVTVVEGVSAGGLMIDPLVIFKGKELVVDWAENPSLTSKFPSLYIHYTNY